MRTVVPTSRTARRVGNLQVIPIVAFTVIAFVMSLSEMPAFVVGAFLLAAAAHVLFAFRVARLGVETDGTVLVVRNVYATHTVPIASVTAVGIEALPHISGKRAIFLELDEGRRLPVFATSVGQWSWKSGRAMMSPEEQAASYEALRRAVDTRRVTVFVRHAPAVVDESVPSSEWPLTATATEAVQALAPHVPQVSKVVTSDMRRARDTAALLGPPVVVDERLREIPRPWTEDLSDAVARYLRGEQLAGWEPQADAIARVVACVAEHGPVVYVSHGTVLSLYLGAVVSGLDAFAFWGDLRHPDAWLLDGEQISRLG